MRFVSCPVLWVDCGLFSALYSKHQQQRRYDALFNSDNATWRFRRGLGAGGGGKGRGGVEGDGGAGQSNH